MKEVNEIQITYEYDNNEYLVRINKTEYDEAGEELYVESLFYEWRDGNIYKISRLNSNYSFNYDDVTIINYTSYPNIIHCHFTDWGRWSDAFGILGWLGYFGKKCKNLPSSATSTFDDHEYVYSRYTYNFDYTFENEVVTNVTKVRTLEGSSTDTFEWTYEWR